MFANIFLLSLLTIIYGTKGDEGGGGNAVERNAMNFLPDLPQQQHASDDLNFMKSSMAQRAIRTPFRNTEIMTARGFGKRGNGDDPENERIRTDQQMNDDYRDETLNNRLREKQILFPFMNQLMRNQEDYAERENIVAPAVKSHRVQIRDGTLKFRLNDGNLRIGRGFGKRSFGVNPAIENHLRALQYFQFLANQNPQLNSLAYNTKR